MNFFLINTSTHNKNIFGESRENFLQRHLKSPRLLLDFPITHEKTQNNLTIFLLQMFFMGFNE